MRVMTSAMAQAWVEYLARQLDNATALNDLEPILTHAHEELECLVKYGLVDYDEATDSYKLFKASYDAAKARLEMLTRVHTFTGDPNPKECQHQHQRWLTGVFYNSQEVLQCLTCQNWQAIRRVIR